MKLSIYTKYWYLLALYLLVGFVLCIYVVESQSTLAVGLFFMWFVICSFQLQRMRCPDCGVHVTYQDQVSGFSISSSFIGRKCKNCGADFCSN